MTLTASWIQRAPHFWLFVLSSWIQREFCLWLLAVSWLQREPHLWFCWLLAVSWLQREPHLWFCFSWLTPALLLIVFCSNSWLTPALLLSVLCPNSWSTPALLLSVPCFIFWLTQALLFHLSFVPIKSLLNSTCLAASVEVCVSAPEEHFEDSRQHAHSLKNFALKISVSISRPPVHEATVCDAANVADTPIVDLHCESCSCARQAAAADEPAIFAVSALSLDPGIVLHHLAHEMSLPPSAEEDVSPPMPEELTVQSLPSDFSLPAPLSILEDCCFEVGFLGTACAPSEFVHPCGHQPLCCHLSDCKDAFTLTLCAVPAQVCVTTKIVCAPLKVLSIQPNVSDCSSLLVIPCLLTAMSPMSSPLEEPNTCLVKRECDNMSDSASVESWLLVVIVFESWLSGQIPSQQHCQLIDE